MKRKSTQQNNVPDDEDYLDDTEKPKYLKSSKRKRPRRGSDGIEFDFLDGEEDSLIDDNEFNPSLLKKRHNHPPPSSDRPTRTTNPMVDETERSRVQTEDMKECYDLLCDLMNNPHSVDFNIPVNWKAMKLFDYPEIITNPLDLGTIKQMLIHNTLQNPDHFAIHVDLVFENAKKYNPPTTPIHHTAINLHRIFTTKYNQLFQLVKDAQEEQPLPNKQEEIDAITKTIETIKYEIATMKEEIASLKQKQPQPKRVRLSKPIQPLTYQQKEDLCSQISLLGAGDLPGLLEIIHPDRTGEGEVEIDIESVDDMTLIRVQKYVQRAVKAKQPRITHPTPKQPRSRPPKPKPVPKPPAHKPPAHKPSMKTIRSTALQQSAKGTAFPKLNKIRIGAIVPISPEDTLEGFWLGQVTTIYPETNTVVVQWFELQNRDCLIYFNKALGRPIEPSIETELLNPKKDTENTDAPKLEEPENPPETGGVEDAKPEEGTEETAKPLEPEGEQPLQLEGEKPPEPEGEKSPEPEGEKPPEPELEKLPEPEGEKSPEPELEKLPEPEGEKPAEEAGKLEGLEGQKLAEPSALISDPTGNIRYYDKSQIFDTVEVDTIYVEIDLRNSFKFDQGRKLWVLTNSLQVMKKIEELDEAELGRQAEEKEKTTEKEQEDGASVPVGGSVGGQ